MLRMIKSVVVMQVALAALLTAPTAMASGAVVSSSNKTVLFWSVHKPNEAIVISAAMSQCGAKFGGDCTLERSFNYGCIAVARSHSHRRWGYAWRPAPQPSRFAAMEACDETGSRTCEIQTTSCE
jgi:Domain of unknown function (DUF4189)